ncbi:hypothetical protein MWU59_12320 [Flavobacteriaceae bacterium F08102]|nr:hypothetical protein [Flavobacteriaceae bacterium F08102]
MNKIYRYLMSMNNELDYIDTYQSLGYDNSYRFKDQRLIENASGGVYMPREIYIVAEHRFEGFTNPDDLSILYVIETKSGSKGTMLIGYGPSADLELAEFFKEVPKHQFSNKMNINFSNI